MASKSKQKNLIAELARERALRQRREEASEQGRQTPVVGRLGSAQ